MVPPLWLPIPKINFLDNLRFLWQDYGAPSGLLEEGKNLDKISLESPSQETLLENVGYSYLELGLRARKMLLETPLDGPNLILIFSYAQRFLLLMLVYKIIL